jgi:ankyrin repeat protein
LTLGLLVGDMAQGRPTEDGGDSLAVMARLIAAGADLHGVDVNGRTPLHLAAARGFEPKARLLLDAGAEVDRRPVYDG